MTGTPEDQEPTNDDREQRTAGKSRGGWASARRRGNPPPLATFALRGEYAAGPERAS
jgi:hypothetical protein